MTEWEAEMYGVKQMIHKFANIPYDDVIGKFRLDSQHSWLLWYHVQEKMKKTKKTTHIGQLPPDNDRKTQETCVDFNDRTTRQHQRNNTHQTISTGYHPLDNTKCATSARQHPPDNTHHITPNKQH